MSILFEAKEPGSMGRSGEDLRPVWDRMREKVDRSGFRGYLEALFHQADTIAILTDTGEWRESEIIELGGKDFTDRTFALEVTQLSLKALGEGKPPYFTVRIAFHYDMDGHDSMEISGSEETYKGVFPKSFRTESPEVELVRNGLVQAMMKPKVMPEDTAV